MPFPTATDMDMLPDDAANACVFHTASLKSALSSHIAEVPSLSFDLIEERAAPPTTASAPAAAPLPTPGSDSTPALRRRRSSSLTLSALATPPSPPPSPLRTTAASPPAAGGRGKRLSLQERRRGRVEGLRAISLSALPTADVRNDEDTRVDSWTKDSLDNLFEMGARYGSDISLQLDPCAVVETAEEKEEEEVSDDSSSESGSTVPSPSLLAFGSSAEGDDDVFAIVRQPQTKSRDAATAAAAAATTTTTTTIAPSSSNIFGGPAASLSMASEMPFIMPAAHGHGEMSRTGTDDGQPTLVLLKAQRTPLRRAVASVLATSV